MTFCAKVKSSAVNPVGSFGRAPRCNDAGVHARPPAVAVGEPAGREALGAAVRHACLTLGAAAERRRSTQPVWLRLPCSARWSSYGAHLPTRIATSFLGPRFPAAIPLIIHLHCGRIQASLQCGRRLQRRRSAAKCYTQRGCSLSIGSSDSLLQGGSALGCDYYRYCRLL